MPSVLRSVAVFAFVSGLAVMSAPGCSQQGEGQRCDGAANGNADCDDGLVCIKAADLQERITDLCCHQDPMLDNESRCARAGAVNTGGTSGVGGSGGTSGGTSEAGSSAGGTGGAAGAAGGTPGETEGGAPGTSGAPATTDGGMSGAPASTTGGAAGDGSSQGGAG